MNKWQQNVLEFHKKFNCLVNNKPSIPSEKECQLRSDLIDEEYSELVDGFANKDIVEVADALTDLLYVVFGTAVSCGIDLEPIWNEVHKTNMLKENGGKRQDGKILKPEGWQPPDINSLLKNQD